MKLTDLAKEIELTEEDLNSEIITRTFPITAYFEYSKDIISEDHYDEYFVRKSDNAKYKGTGSYNEDGLFIADEDHVVESSIIIKNGEIVSASYSIDNFRNKTAGDSVEDDVNGVIQLWINTFEL